MTKAELIIWAVVLVVGWTFYKGGNLTAGALLLAWLAGQIVYLLTGNNLPVEFYLYPDIFVLAVIFAKPERTRADWFVAAIFPVQWVFYIAAVSDYTRWWTLYYLVLAQLIVAGADSFLTYRRTRAVSSPPDKMPDRGFQFAYARRGYG